MRRAALAFLVAAALAAQTGTAAAAWAPSGNGSDAAKAKQMPNGNQPTASISNRDVTVSWAASSFSGGGNVSGYTVKRYDTNGNSQSIGSACSGTVSGLTCTENGVPAGTWKYSVTPKQGNNWTGTESSQSASVTVQSPSFSFTSSTTVTSLPATLNGNISNYIQGQTITFRLDDPNTGTVLSGSISPSPVPASGNASATVTIPAGTSNGPHTVYAVGSQGDTASAAITVSVNSSLPVTTSAWDIRDATIGSELNESDGWAFGGDTRVVGTGNWTTSFTTARYLQFAYGSALPGGLPTSSVNFNFRFAASSSQPSETACFYFEVRRTSTGAVIGTHGSSASPVGCVTGTTQTTFTTALSEVTSSDIADDLSVRVFVKNSRSNGILGDLATVSGTSSPGTSSAQSFTLYENRYTDDSPGNANPNSSPWSLAFSGDGWFYGTQAGWASTFSSTRYLKLTFPSYAPSSATVSGASFVNSYRGINSSNTCYYFEVLSGGTVIGTHGSTSSPVSCNASANYVTDTVSLPEVNTAARANGLVIKIYASNASGFQSQHDLATMSFSYTP
jgi:hypothetical protein